MNEFAKPGLANDQFPPVSAIDNGKVLTVADGKWVVGNASGGTTVVANPTLAGTEADLTGLQVGDTKYKVPEGGSGGNVVVAHFERTVSSDGASVSTTCDKTFSELDAARTQGADIIGALSVADDYNGYYFTTMFIMVYAPEQTFPFPASAEFSGETAHYDGTHFLNCWASITASASNNINSSVQTIQ